MSKLVKIKDYQDVQFGAKNSVWMQNNVAGCTRPGVIHDQELPN